MDRLLSKSANSKSYELSRSDSKATSSSDKHREKSRKRKSSKLKSKHQKKSKKHSKSKKRKRKDSTSSEDSSDSDSSDSSSSTSSSSSSTSSSEEERRKKKKAKKSKKEKEKKKKLAEAQMKKIKQQSIKPPQSDSGEDIGPGLDLISSKSRAPMTKEEYDKLQKRLTHVVDPETGRHRLIRGTGEVVEELVSRHRHATINKEATKNDGEFFYKQSIAQAAKNVWGK